MTIVTKREPLSDQELQKQLGVAEIIRPKQVHGNTVAIVKESSQSQPEADAIFTDQKGIGLSISWADCQNFLIFHPGGKECSCPTKVLGLLHSGWRGLIKEIIPRTYNALQKEWGIKPEETYVWAGPSLCQSCAEFTDPDNELRGISKQFFDGRCVNLQGIADAQFQSIGVPTSHIKRHPDCTCCHPESYWTYRGGDRGEVRRGKVNWIGCALASNDQKNK